MDINLIQLSIIVWFGWFRLVINSIKGVQVLPIIGSILESAGVRGTWRDAVAGFITEIIHQWIPVALITYAIYTI